MSLAFLVPAFLVGLAALAIPILIHLTRKETRDAVRFPSLMFIRQVPHKSTSRRAVDRWPLLLLRLLGLALLIFAFSRPFVGSEDGDLLPVDAGGREVVVLLDRSYSMGLGARWDQAIAAANEAVQGMGQNDRGTILLFDSRAEMASPTTMDRGELQASLRAVEPGPRATRYAPALRYAQRLLAASPMPRREIVLISDFQRAGWDEEAAEAGTIRMPPGTEIRPVHVGVDEIEPNLTIASVTIDRSAVDGRERGTVTARLVASGDGVPANLPVVLEIDGRPIETQEIELGGARSATAAFEPIIIPADAALRAAVRVPDDALAIDNAFHFVLSADQRIGALIVEGPGTPPGASYFLERSLALGQSPGFRTETRNVARLTSEDLVRYPVMIFNQTALPGGEIGERLRARVKGGAGLIFVAGDNSLGEWDGVLPGLGRRVDRSAQGGTTLGYVDLGHPIFEPFTAPRSGDFTSARVFQYRPIEADARVLARFGDGGAALVEQPYGRGRILVWSSTLDRGWNDLVLQPVFVPFVHQLTRYAAGYAPSPPWQLVGDPFDPGATDPFAAPYTLALTPGGDRVAMDDSQPLALEEPGFYELRDQRTGARGALVAVNVDPAEAALESFDPAELVGTVMSGSGSGSGVAEMVPLTLAERERQQNAWWYLLVLAFLLLAAETVVSNRFYRGATPLKG